MKKRLNNKCERKENFRLPKNNKGNKKKKNMKLYRKNIENKSKMQLNKNNKICKGFVSKSNKKCLKNIINSILEEKTKYKM